MRKTAKYYAKNSKALKKKREYDKKYNAKPENVKKRVELNRINRQKGTYGNNDNRDNSHNKDGSTSQENQSTNRARNGMKRGRSKRIRTNTRK